MVTCGVAGMIPFGWRGIMAMPLSIHQATNLFSSDCRTKSGTSCLMMEGHAFKFTLAMQQVVVSPVRFAIGFDMTAV